MTPTITEDPICVCGHPLSVHHDHIIFADNMETEYYREYQTCDLKFVHGCNYGCEGFYREDEEDMDEYQYNDS